MVHSHQLHRNTGIVDPLLFSEDTVDSYFWYHGYKTVKNFFLVRKDVAPNESQASFGNKSNFKIPNLADKWGTVQLMFHLGQLTTTGGTYRRFVDFVGFCAWEWIALEFSTNEVYTIYPEDLFLKYRHLCIEHREAEGEIIIGDKSDAERDLAAADPAGQDLIVDLSFPHTRATTHWMEIMQLAQEPRVIIKWRNLSDIVVTDGTLPQATLSDVELRCTYVHFDNDERDNNTYRVEQEDGVIRLFDDFKLEYSDDIPIGTTGERRYKINNFRTSTKTFTFLLRRKTDTTTPLDNNYFGNLQQVKAFYLESADGKIIEPIEDKYARFYLWPLHHEAPAGDYIYEINFGLEPDNLIDASGSYNFGNATNITLVVDFGSVPTTDVLYITMCANEYNTHQHVRGDVQKNFK